MNAPNRFHGGVWSLWEMINFQLREFLYALDYVGVARVRTIAANPNDLVAPHILDEIDADLERVRQRVVEMSLPLAEARLAKLSIFFGPSHAITTFGQLTHEIDELEDALRMDALNEFFCHYDSRRVGYTARMEGEWRAVFSKFKSVEGDVRSGLDCYSLGHNTACVFYMARVGEFGLRVIGRERGVKSVRGKVPIEWGTWGQVLGAIEGNYPFYKVSVWG